MQGVFRRHKGFSLFMFQRGTVKPLCFREIPFASAYRAFRFWKSQGRFFLGNLSVLSEVLSDKFYLKGTRKC